MTTKFFIGLTGALALAGSLAGCGEDLLDLNADDAQDIAETKSAATAVVGCAALVETAEAHVGALLGYTSPGPEELTLSQIRFKVSNPSAVDCASVEIAIQLTNDATGRVLKHGSVTTSFPANKYRWITANWSFDSRTYTPKVDSQEDVWTYRNGNLMKATYLPAYFVNTNQY